MKIKRKIGILFLIVSLIFLFKKTNFNITGNFINNYFQRTFLFQHFLGLVLLVISMILLTSNTKKSLEAIIVPTGVKKANIKRGKKAGENYNVYKRQYFIISGAPEEPLKKSGRASIYRELRKYGIKPLQMNIEGKSRDSLENVIYSLKKLRKNTKKISFVSSPWHVKKFKYIIEKAKQEGYVPKDLEVEYITTNQNIKDTLYGILALIKEKYKLRKGIDYALKHKTGKIGNLIKKLINWF